MYARPCLRRAFLLPPENIAAIYGRDASPAQRRRLKVFIEIIPHAANAQVHFAGRVLALFRQGNVKGQADEFRQRAGVIRRVVLQAQHEATRLRLQRPARHPRGLRERFVIQFQGVQHLHFHRGGSVGFRNGFLQKVVHDLPRPLYSRPALLRPRVRSR